jgi:galactose-1-phosphate uridylyltransferase
MNRIDRGMIKIMPDGTEKHVNPFTGTEVWFIPGRKSRPIFTAAQAAAQKIEKKVPEDYCNFCPTRYLNTPPEKSRLLGDSGKYIVEHRIAPEDVRKREPLFRRIPNLFEIVTINYWKKNFDYHLSDQNEEWKERYLSSAAGREHAFAIIDLKLKYLGFSDDEIKKVKEDEKIEMTDAFFGGAHELIIPRRHYIEGAEYNSQLFSSGELTPEEHFQYFKFTIQSMDDIYKNNRYVRYIAVFQNWLKEAGASFDHLHKQLVALDEWGVSLERELDMAYRSPNMYNEYAANYAAYNNYVICENDFAMAFVELGHRHPTIGIYSKSSRCRPSTHTDEELRGLSDLVHAVHAATGSQISCNEEWYYMPRDSVIPIPWHILIKWRVNIAAGFEGGTKIYVNPVSLTELRDQMVPRLFSLRDQRKIAWFKIAEECPVKPNSLQYYKNGVE